MLGRIAIDTESHGVVPWSIQVSICAGTALLVLIEDTEALQELVTNVNILIDAGWILTFHHCIADLDIVERVGIKVNRFSDTIQESFHQCSLPQGLKPLAYRLLGVTMRSWEDVVWPASVDKMIEWIGEAILVADSKLYGTKETEYKRPVCAECSHPHKDTPCKKCKCMVGWAVKASYKKVERVSGAAESILRHILTHTGKTIDDDEPYHPWKMLAKMKVDGLRGKKASAEDWHVIEEQVGLMPILGIGNCELADAVRYGCGDADMTGQVAKVLEERRGDDKWQVDEEDWDR